VLWVFDVNETLLDLSPLDGVFERHTGVPGLRAEWFDLLIRSALATTAAGQYRDFAQLGAACAGSVAQAHGTRSTEAVVAQLAATMRALPVHPEVPTALAALRERGHRLVALANSPQAVVQAQLDHAKLATLMDAVYSAEGARALKPAAAPYRLVLTAENVAPDQAVMVAAHDWDIAGAQAVGMRTAFVARGGRRPLPSWPDPDLVAADLAKATGADPARSGARG
jgi:2-haloacid dehalogenase